VHGRDLRRVGPVAPVILQVGRALLIANSGATRRRGQPFGVNVDEPTASPTRHLERLRP
jgi:hypothetical protein